jgi:hypothetical protein
MIDINYLIVRDKVKNDVIVMQYINTRTMLVASLTKTLSLTLYKKHVADMSLINES